MQRDGPVNLPYPGRRTRRLVVVTKGLFLILLTLLSIAQAIPIHPANASNSPSDQPAGRAALPPTGSISPTAGGAGPVPDLSLPKTVLSNVEKLIGAGGVIQSSKDNLTLYNSLLAMRLLGGAFPHDELLGPDRRVVSSYSFWGLETQVGGLWTPLIPVSNSLSQMGTNESGTFVRRTMDVVTGPYGGTFSIIYRADSKGALKWSLGFTPATFSRYRLVYAWWNVTGDYALSSPAKQFRVGYRVANFTMSWGDVPDSYNATTNIQSSRFFLTIDLGKILPGNSILIDPSIVASGVAAGSTSYTFQRKVFYEPKGGYYWVFYFTGTRMNYSSSRDGTSWSLPQSIPSSLYPQGYQGAEFYLAPVYIVGQTVIVASGETAICGVGTVSVRYLVGTISGSSLQWGAVQIADTISGICSGGALGVRYVNVAASSDGYFAFSYNWYMVGDSGQGVCSGGYIFSESGVFVKYRNLPTAKLSCNSDADSGVNHSVERDRSIVLGADTQGGVRVVYQFSSGSKIQLLSRTVDKNGNLGTLQILDGNVPNTDEFSATVDTNYNPHVLFKAYDGNITSATQLAPVSSWVYYKKVFSSPAMSPTITVDYSTNDLYALAINGTSIEMRNRSIVGNWSDTSVSYPVIQRPSPANLGSNFASASYANSSRILLVWTEGSSPYSVAFASVPIQTVWSPYSSPSDPWDGNGLAPYGQYFANLGESVSPSTGMLTVRQTDFSVAGRGLGFEVTRVYEEPYSFLSAGPFQYDSYPWAPLGNGWQLNFPWFKNVAPSYPTYIHLWDGQGYRVPYDFWKGTTTVFENHQGEHFRLMRNSTGIFLYAKSGLSYRFDMSYKLTKIADPSGNNTITFVYDGSNHISTVTDSALRVFLFCYSGGLVQSIYQTSGTCASPGTARSVRYGYGGGSLTNVTDPGGRVTSFLYSAVGNSNIAPWLLSRVTYPTQWYANYTYTPRLLGTQANTYRVSSQLVYSTTTAIRRFDYTYSPTAGDPVSNSTVTSYDGASGLLKLAGYTRYSYSFAGMTMNVSDANNRLMSGTQQRFGVNGEIPREIVLALALNTWYWTKSNPGSGWNFASAYAQDSSWNIAPAVANYSRPSPPWGPITGWQDAAAKWIWWNPDAATTSTNDPVWFRTAFYMSKQTNVMIEATVDDTYTLYLDGSSPPANDGNWQTRETWNVTLTQGYHVIGVAADNTGAGNPAGLLLSIRNVSTGEVFLRTDTSIGSYTNYYRYDLWGNMIYSSRKVSSSDIVDSYGFPGVGSTGGSMFIKHPAPLPQFEGFQSEYGQCFSVPNSGGDRPLTAARFLLARAGSFVPTVNMYAALYATTGTPNVNCYPANAPGIVLVESQPVNASILTYDKKTVTFAFNSTSQFVMRAGQTYGIAIHAHGPGTLYSDASITVGTVGSQPIHPGNLFYYDGFDNGPDYDACSSSGCSVGPTDLIFEVDSSVSYESFNAYYNNGLSPGFYAFQDSFSQANYTRPNEPWTVNNGTWVTSSGVAFRDTSFNTGGWTTESSAVSNTSQDTTDGETDKLSATFTAGTAGFYRIVRSFATAIDGNVYPKLVVRLKSSIAKNLLRVEIRDGVTWHDPTDGNSDLWKKSAGWTIAVLNLQGWSSINTLKLGITSEFDTSISGPQSGWFDYAFIANDVPTSQDDMVGQYSGSLAGGAQEAVFAWSDIGKPDISIQARVFILSKLATSEARVGLMTHYAGSGLGKWALVVHNTTSGVKLSLLEEYVAWRVETSCTGVTTKNWYTLNFTIRGVSATGWLSGPNGLYCPVSGSFGGGSLSTATGFGLYSGGYSALFDNLVVATVFPYLASKSFSNSFITNGAPGQNIHSAVAGTAQLTNGTTTSPAESYFSYYSWGGINQSKQRYDPTPPAVQWLTTSTVYDTYGNPKTSIDARSYPTYYTYSANYTYAYLTNQTRLDGVTKITTLYAYNLTTGNVRIVTDPKGNATSYQNDNLGRVKRIAYPLGAYVNYTYNDSANYVDTVNENKTKTRQIYDGLARQTIVDKFLNGASYSNETSRYNWQSKILNRTDTLGNVYRFAYDVVGRTVNATRPNGKSTLQFYNDLASWIRTMDEDGNYKCTIYDRLGRLVSVVERAAADCQTGIVTNYYYNEVGNLRKVTNSLSKSTSYTYDNLGQLTKTVYPDNYNETYTYDNNGNMVNSTDRNSVKTMRSYDSLNRLKTITYCGSLGITPIIGTSYTYDKNGNPLQMKNENATVTYIYDARNRVLNETSAVNLANRQVVDLGCFGPGGTLTRNGGVSKTYIVGFTYKGEYLDTLMYPTISQSNPDITIRYAYDGLGRVLNVTRIGTSTYYARSFTYYKSNQVKGMQFGNSLIGNYTYDNLSRPSTIALSGATTMSLTYTYNNTGTVASVVGALNGATVNEQYRYDALQRLTNYTTTSSASTTSGWYEYDNAGNRLRQKLNSTITAYSYNSLNQLINSTAYTTPQTKIYYGYDLNGNLKIQNVTTSGTVRWTYAWDAANHLLKVTNSTGQALYAYDGMGRMVEQVESSSTWFLAYKGTEILYKNLLNTNNQAYVFAAGLKIARVVDRTAMYYYHTDPLGSTRMITYNDATFVFKDNYQPFGRDNGTPTGNLANTEKDRFTGKTYSSATGLYYYYHRWYDPSVGRFVSWDPQPGELTSPQTGNVYVYVINSPVNYNDPRGEFFNVLIGAIAGAAIGGAVCAWQHGGWSNSCLTSIAIGALAGAVAGLTFNPALGLAAQAGLSGLGASVLAGAISGAVSGVASYGAQGISATASGQQFNWSVTDLAVSVGLGALGGAAGGAVGYGVGRLVSSLGRGGSGAIGKIAGGLEDGGSKSIRLAQGATLRRVFGGGSKPFGPSWTTMDSATPGFPDALELPPTNDMNGIMSAYFPPGTPVTIMKTTGGAVEVVVDRAWFWAALPRVISW